MRHKDMKRLVRVFVLLGAAVSRAWGGMLVVDQRHPAAGDGNPGTPDLPFKSIAAAVAKAQAGDTVTIHAGVYRETIRVTTTGTKEKPIVIQAEMNGSVVVSGADVLPGWVREAGSHPVYSVAWSHDFMIARDKAGKPIRWHGNPAPVGCAEQVFFDQWPLQQVMSNVLLKAGTFYVDWDIHRLYVWLPGGGDPATSSVEASVRPNLLYADERTKPEYIQVKGIVFRRAANFAQRGGVSLSTGWHLEDCVVEENNGGGVKIEGSDIVVLRVTAQDNGITGIGGSGGTNILLQDCISRRNNRKGFSVSWEGGGGKFVKTTGLRIIGHTAYDNTGPGIWLDWGNRDYMIESCVVYGNHGNKHDWEGMGIFSECNEGPGVIASNIVYSNTGEGISLAESQQVRVEGNTVVDCGSGVGLRAMDGRADHKLDHVVMRGNVFKAWRGTALGTSLGTWNRASVQSRSIVVDGNLYAPPEPTKALVTWGKEKFDSLKEVQSALGIEQSGRLGSVAFDRKLVNNRASGSQTIPSMADALAGAKPEDMVVVPVNGRLAIVAGEGGWTCQVFDLNNHFLSLAIRERQARTQLEERVSPYPRSETVFLRVRMADATATPPRAVLVDLGVQ